MVLHCLYGFVADDVLYLAGICFGSFLRNAQTHKKFGKQTVALIGLFGKGQTAFGKRYIAVGINGYESVFLEKTHSAADAGLFIACEFRYIYRTHTIVLLEQKIDALEVHFA